MNRNILFYSRCLLAFVAILGTTLQIYLYGAGMLLYYIVLSNLLVAVFSVYMVVAMYHKKDLQNQSFLRVKAGVTMSIMITFVIYHFMLAPLVTDFWRLENILCHYIVPLYFFIDTLLIDHQSQYRWYDPIFWTVLPVLYMIFALFNGLVVKIPIPAAVDSPFAYFFLNVTKYGWQFVLTYAAGIFVSYVLAGYVFYMVKSLSWKRKD
ncbi:Pr6Pr family membrane protein [Streptococcus ovis]|uniref:Pr6Pr family membrane protein n=1 Tax=Streptococcus ovis TaxID=82806 RepID=UPI00037726D2|nr:Pr6Pr family membrane protein [Streptococcus ovis]